jgi:hypothetical protein
MYALAIRHLKNIVPKFYNGRPGPPGVGRGGGWAYGMVFPDRDLRDNIETFLIDKKGDRMEAKPLPPTMLRLQVVRDTIQKVLDGVEEMKRADPEVAGRLRLM